MKNVTRIELGILYLIETCEQVCHACIDFPKTMAPGCETMAPGCEIVADRKLVKIRL